MTKNVAYLISPTGISVFVDGKQFVVSNDHPNFTKIKDNLKNRVFDGLVELIDVRTSVVKWLSTSKDFALENDVIVYQNDAFSNAVTDKVLRMIDAGHDAEPLFNFLRKVRLNPSKTAQDELLLFCVANNFMIHTDGDIVAYKSVRENYNDIHSNTVSNKVGTVVEMARHKVDDNRDRTCSHGLHFASYHYASTWAGREHNRLMVLKVNPRDVVSIPSDYSNQKGRCARYEVIAELSEWNPLPEREVYTTTDLGGTAVDTVRLDELYAQQDELEADVLELTERIGEIEALGGIVPDSMMMDLHELEDQLATVFGEIDELVI